MRIFLRHRKRGWIPYGIIYGTIALCALAAVRFLPLSLVLPSCPFLRITGFSCPTCGATRALQHLAHGKLTDAAVMNPLIIVLILISFCWFITDAAVFLTRGRTPVLETTGAERDAGRIVAAVLFIANWAFLLARS